MADGAATAVPTVGPLVEIAPGIWVNALHVAAIVPIEGIKAGEPLLQCRVYVAGPSLGGGHVLAWNSRITPVEMAAALTLALQRTDRERGYWEERGRIQALDGTTEGEEDDDGAAF